jgi:hypothetical protein
MYKKHCLNTNHTTLPPTLFNDSGLLLYLLMWVLDDDDCPTGTWKEGKSE